MNNWWLSPLTFALAVYGIFFILFLVMRLLKEWQRRKFVSVFKKAIDLGTIHRLEDVNNIIEAVYGRQNDDSHQNFVGSMFLLRLALVSIYESNEGGRAKEHKELVSKLIEECKRVAPYSELPKAEKSILTDVESYLSANCPEDVRRKLGELATKIKDRHDDLVKLESQSRWSLPLTMASIALTIIFGVLSIKR